MRKAVVALSAISLTLLGGTAATAATEEEKLTLVYVYKKLNPAGGPGWGNSSTQVLWTVTDGHVEPSITTVPAGTCGPDGWAVQWDWTVGLSRDEVPATLKPNTLPDGSLVRAEHRSLDSYVNIPECEGSEEPVPGEEEPSPSPSPSPQNPGEEEPSPSPSPSPSPQNPGEEEPSPSPSPSPQNPGEEEPTQTPTPTQPAVVPVRTVTPVSKAAPTRQVATRTAAAPTRRLAETGSDGLPQTLLAVFGLLAVGAAVTRIGRSRSAADEG